MIYFVKGALERVLDRCTKFYSDGDPLPLQDRQKQIYVKEAYRMGCNGLRGKTQIFVSTELYENYTSLLCCPVGYSKDVIFIYKV